MGIGALVKNPKPRTRAAVQQLLTRKENTPKGGTGESPEYEKQKGLKKMVKMPSAKARAGRDQDG